MKKTLNNLIQKLEEIVEAHYFFNAFYYGDIATSLNSEDSKQYPALYCNIVAGSMDDSYTYFNIDLFACDLVNDDNTEEVEVESDTVQDLRDIYQFILHSSDWQSFSTVSTPLFATRKYNDRLQDHVTGWSMTISLAVKSKSGICDLPIEGVTPPPAEVCEPVTVYLNGVLYEVVPSGGSVDVPCVAGDYDIYLNNTLMRSNLLTGDTIELNTTLMKTL